MTGNDNPSPIRNAQNIGASPVAAASATDGTSTGGSCAAKFLFVVGMAILIAMVASHLLANWIGLPKIGATYRRIGPQTGPQVFCAGSSLLQFGLSWPEISEKLGQGIENWGVGGSSPSEWEASQKLATNADLMIIGVSVYDLNEYHLCDSRANIVPLMQTIRDLWQTQSTWQFSKRVVSQYPLAWLRTLFPTAGNSDAVLVGLRRRLPRQLRAAAAVEDRANAMVLPKEAVLDFGASTEKLSDWPAAKSLRRLALMRSETQGQQTFNGPKALAFRRMLQAAQERGRIIVVVLPVAPAYAHAFLTPAMEHDFENVLADAQRAFPQAVFVRLDQVPVLNSDEYFADPVHLNGDGRSIATPVFLNALKQLPALQ